MKNIYFIFPKDRVGDEPPIVGIGVGDYDRAVKEMPGVEKEAWVFADFLSVLLVLEDLGIANIGVTGQSPEDEPTVIKIKKILSTLGYRVLTGEEFEEI